MRSVNSKIGSYGNQIDEGGIMKGNRRRGQLKCYGSTVVGPRGQVVIPVSARKELGIESGDTLLTFEALGYHRGLLLVKVDTLEEMLGMMSNGLGQFEKMIKDKKSQVSINADEE
jgi:AbrB family looped-hinge helix DNA binding protein